MSQVRIQPIPKLHPRPLHPDSLRIQTRAVAAAPAAPARQPATSPRETSATAASAATDRSSLSRRVRPVRSCSSFAVPRRASTSSPLCPQSPAATHPRAPPRLSRWTFQTRSDRIGRHPRHPPRPVSHHPEEGGLLPGSPRWAPRRWATARLIFATRKPRRLRLANLPPFRGCPNSPWPSRGWGSAPARRRRRRRAQPRGCRTPHAPVAG